VFSDIVGPGPMSRTASVLALQITTKVVNGVFRPGKSRRRTWLGLYLDEKKQFVTRILCKFTHSAGGSLCASYPYRHKKLSYC